MPKIAYPLTNRKGQNQPKTRTFINFILSVLQNYLDEEDQQVLYQATIPIWDVCWIFSESGDESKF